MKPLPQRRRHERFPLDEMRVVPLTLLSGYENQPPRNVQGWVENISRGGLCLRTEAPLPLSDPLRCEIAVHGDLDVGVPVLMQVRWNQQGTPSDGFRSGLEFLV